MADIIGQVNIALSSLKQAEREITNILALKNKVGNSLKKDITCLVELLLAGAIVLKASDLHLEPEKEQAKIRIRIDGILQDTTTIPLPSYETLLSRIKLLSGLKLNISDRPQDGRFSVALKETTIEIRASSLPSEYGETIVLRILNPKNLIEIEELGLRKDLLEISQREIRKPNGMIIVTGPTGCGKTTTLYAFLKKIQKPEIKIITIEDPIEYHLAGVSQTQTQPEKGYGFANGLRSILRQDPDVILVGEIRDLETVDVALQASLTGHLVFSTLHTNDAIGAIARLVNLGAKPQNIGSALNLVVAQRLIRRLCPKCKKLVKASPTDLAKIKKALQGLPETIKAPRPTPALGLPATKGCLNCNFTGYQGRIGIFEGFLVDEEMEKLILQDSPAPLLKQKALQKGFVSLRQDGFLRVLEGLTTVGEIERVAGE